MTDDASPGGRQIPIEDTVLERTVEETDVAEDDLVDALAVLDAQLRGRHSELESGAYVAGDGKRAYEADDEFWADVTDGMEFDDETLAAARQAHRRQAQFVADGAVENLDLRDGGVVIGVDTAEEMV